MFEGDQDAEESDQMFACPCDSSHPVTASGMSRHLVKCRNFLVTEKAIFPFNDQHVIFAPEMDYHKLLCPDKPEETDKEEATTEDVDSKNRTHIYNQLGNSSATETCHSSDQETAMKSTGCESGLDLVGGISSSVRGTDDTTLTALPRSYKATEEAEPPQNGISESCHDPLENDFISPMAELVSPNHNIAIEKQLEQSECATASSGTNGAVGNDALLEEERFDYTKYIPSKDLREDFLKLIKQDKDMQVHEEKYQMLSEVYGSEIWPQSYSFVPNQFQSSGGFQPPAIQAAYISYPSMYSMIPPYTGPYSVSNHLPGMGSFLQAGPDQRMTYGYNLYPVARQHDRPNYRRRNHHNSFHPRVSNHNNYINCQNYDSHSESFYLNDTNHSELSTIKENLCLQKVNGNPIHDDNSSNTQVFQTRNGCHNEKHSLSFSKHTKTSHAVESQTSDVYVQQFVDIGEVQYKSTNGDVVQDDECDCSFHGAEEVINGELQESEKSEYKKQIRKLRKKLCEISDLEEKCYNGVKLDSDQLKKLSRKSEFEEQLRLLTLC